MERAGAWCLQLSQRRSARDLYLRPHAFLFSGRGRPREPLDGHSGIGWVVASAGGFAYIFWTVAAPASRQFYQLDVMSNRTAPGVTTCICGAAGADLDGDGFLDHSTVNEDSHDIRVFMNRADGTGHFHPFLQPPLPIGIEASPNEPADFNGDGHPDIAAAAGSSNSVWIALGNGDGTFDLVVGVQASQRIVVHLGNGNGTFTQEPFVASGGSVWMVVCGDVNGDGDMDWVLFSFGGGQWRVFANNGAGVFAHDQTFNAVSNPSCAMILDFDNDRDLDIVLTDGIADLVTLRQNIGPAILGEMNCDGRIDGKDIAGFVAALLTPSTYVAGHPSSWDYGGNDHRLPDGLRSVSGLRRTGLGTRAAA